MSVRAKKRRKASRRAARREAFRAWIGEVLADVERAVAELERAEKLSRTAAVSMHPDDAAALYAQCARTGVSPLGTIAIHERASLPLGSVVHLSAAGEVLGVTRVRG